MAGLFDDLIPQGRRDEDEEEPRTAGLFDDLIPTMGAQRGLDRRPTPDMAPTPAMPEEPEAPAPMQAGQTPETLGGTRRASEIRDMLSSGTLTGPARTDLETELAMLEGMTPQIARGVSQAVAEAPASDAPPIEANPDGTALGRATERGVLRTSATLPAMTAASAASALRDAGETDQGIIAQTFHAVTGQWPTRGQDISTPEKAAGVISQMGGSGANATTFRELYEARLQRAEAARVDPEAYRRSGTEALRTMQNRLDRAAKIPFSPQGQRMQQVLQDTPDTFGDTFMAFVRNPVDAATWLTEIAAESAPQMAASAAVGVVTRSPALGAATMAVGGMSQEFGASVGEFLDENGVKLESEADARALLNNPDLMSKAAARGLGRGVVIAAAEAVGQGVAARQLLKSNVGNAFAQVLVQGATGAGGEAGARAATGQKMSPREILIEGLAEGVSAPIEVGGAVIADRRQAAQDRIDTERANSPRLTEGDRRSPLRNDYLDDGKRIIEDAISGQPPAPRAPVAPIAPVAGQAPAAPAAAPAPAAPRAPQGLNQAPAAPARPADDFTLPDGAVPAADLFGDEGEELDSPPTVQFSEPGNAPPAAPPAAPVAPERAAENAEAEEATAAQAQIDRRNISTLTEQDVLSVETDAKTFQYKDGGDSDGITDRLRGIKQWEPTRAGLVIVYEYADGRRVIADGHQRLGLAKKLAGEGQKIDLPVYTIRETDGHSPAYARRVAAEKNIAEGSGTALDAAKVLRESGRTLEDANLPTSGTMTRDAEGIAALDETAFGMVINEVASEKHGALVGQLVKDKARHTDILAALTKAEPRNMTQAEFMVRDAMRDDVTETQSSLFGDEEVKVNLVEERAKVIDRTLKDLGREISTFKVLNDRGETITGAGNVLNEEGNAARLDESGRARNSLMTAATTKGPISDALSEAARAVRDGKPVAEASRDFAAKLRSIEAGQPQQIAGSQAGGAGGRDEQAQGTGQAQGLTEQTPEGEQFVIPGTERRPAPARPAEKPEAAPLPEGGLFDEAAQQQTDINDAITAPVRTAAPLGNLETFRNNPIAYVRGLSDDHARSLAAALGKKPKAGTDPRAVIEDAMGDLPATVRNAKVQDWIEQQSDVAPGRPAPAQRPGAQGYAYKLADGLTQKQQKDLAKWRGGSVGELIGELDAVARRAESAVRAKGLDIRDFDAAGRDADGKYNQMAVMVREAEKLAGEVLDRAAEKRSGQLDELTYDEDTGELSDDQEGPAYEAALFLENAEAQSPPTDEASTGNPNSPDDADLSEMDPAKVFAKPNGKTVNIDVKLPKSSQIPLDEAKGIVDAWRKVAADIGARVDNSNKVIISLFDYTGAWAQPWRDAGYKVVQHDIKFGSDLMFDAWIIEQIEEMRAAGMEIYGVLAACPCTTYASSGARWWKPRHDKEDVAELVKVFGPKAPASGAKSAVEFNNMLVDATRDVVMAANPTGFHALENPIGRIEKKAAMPNPAFRFQPSNFGDPYTKRTQIWGDVQTDLPTANVAPTDGSKMQSTLRGDDPLGKEKRSTTPDGFAYAFFMANDPEARKLKDQNSAAPNPVPAAAAAATGAKRTPDVLAKALTPEVVARLSDGAARSYADGIITGAAYSPAHFDAVGFTDEQVRNLASAYRDYLEESDPAAFEAINDAMTAKADELAQSLFADMTAKGQGPVDLDKMRRNKALKDAHGDLLAAAQSQAGIERLSAVLMSDALSQSAFDERMFAEIERADAPGYNVVFIDRGELLNEGPNVVSIDGSSVANAGPGGRANLDYIFNDLGAWAMGEAAIRASLAKFTAKGTGAAANKPPAPPIADSRAEQKKRDARAAGRRAQEEGDERTPPEFMGDELGAEWLAGYGEGIAAQAEADAKVQAEFDAIAEQTERDKASAEPVDMADFEAAGMTVNGGKAWLKQPANNGKGTRTYSVSKLWNDSNKRWNLKASRSTDLGEGPKGPTNPPTVQLGDFPTTETALIVMREDGMETPEAAPAPAPSAPAQAPNAGNGSRGGAAKPGPKFDGERADNTSSLTLEEQDRLAQLRAKMRDKLKNQLNSGLDPELVAIAAEMGAIYIKAGARRFRDLLRAMMEDLGIDFATAQPYARGAYNQVRDDMNLDGQSIDGMDSSDDVIAAIRAMRDESAQPGEVGSVGATDPTGATDYGALGAAAFASGAPRRAPLPSDLPGVEGNDTKGYTAAAKSWLNGWDRANLAAPVPELEPIRVTDAPAPLEDNLRGQVIEAFRSELEAGRGFKTIIEARKHFEKATGKEYRPSFAKGLEEAIEIAVVKVARQIATTISDPAEAYAALVDLYGRQPNLAERTSSSIERQAYSTPAPLAYLASRLAGIEKGVKVYEPTAGNGMLLIEASPKDVQANELGQERIDGLRRALGDDAKITEGDAMAHKPGPYDVLVTNPPFGKVRDGVGKVLSWDMPVLGGTTSSIDHAISAKALAGLHEDDGVGVLIIGGQPGNTPDDRKAEYRKGDSRAFFKKLYDNYQVVSHFTVAGPLYSRQGASWPVDVIVTTGRGKSEKPYPMAAPPVLYKSWDDLGSYFDGQNNLDTRGLEDGARDGGDGAANQAADPQPVSGGAGVSDRPAGDGGNAAGSAAASEPDGGGGRGAADSGAAGAGGRPTGVGERGANGSLGDGRPEMADPAAADQAGDGTDAGADAGGVSGDALPRDRVARENKEAETAFQVQYAPRSGATFAVGTLVPNNMQQAISRALDDLEARVGDIDTFVARELGYTVDEVVGTPAKPGYFSAEQVDAMALAIDNLKKGRGFIIGDQTGVGKGRFVAAMLRWAAKNGKAPVFVSKDPGLYADMVRDLRDIGMPDAHERVMMTNAGMRNAQALPLSSDEGDVLAGYTPSKLKAAVATIQATGKLPDGVDMLFTTYSQMQRVAGAETDRMEALRMLAPNAMFVLDESHEAGGVAAATGRGEDSGPPPRSEFIRALLNEADSAVFSSATYAKNPAVMSLYYKTDLSLITDDPAKLAGVIEAGGVPMQQVVSGMLVEAGQYARRERSFEGVEMDLEQLVTDQAMAVRGAEVIRTLFRLDSEVMEQVRADFIDKAGDDGLAGVVDNAVGGLAASSTNFASTMHNLASQFLLAIKVDAVVEKAIALHKDGKKPIIALSNTNAAIIEEAAEDAGATIGDELKVPFNVILERYLARLRRITLKDENENKTYYFLTDAQIAEYGGPEALAAFNDAKNVIRNADLSGLPGAPIDAILDRLRAAGIGADEITGRNTTLADGVLTKRDSSPAAKKRVMSDYNSGVLDALVINRSGSTGFSMHAILGRPGNDGKLRHMIILQPEPNIDLFMQMLGRIHRTGQTSLPGYTIAVSDLAVEKRPAAVLMRKMSSLNANTTASKKSAVSLDNVTDFLNVYGDRVVVEFLRDNPDIMGRLNLWVGEKASENVNIAAKFTGRLVTLDPKEVTAIYDQVETAYRAYVESLDRLGINTLEAKILELDAKTISSTQVVAARDESSPFGQPAFIEVLDVKRLGKPYTPVELETELEDALAGKTAQAALAGHIEALNAQADAASVAAAAAVEKLRAAQLEARTQKQQDKAADMLRRAEAKVAQIEATRADAVVVLSRLEAGKIGTITVKEGQTEAAFAGMSLGADLSKLSGNGFAMSQITVRVAVADASREVSVPLSRMLGAEPNYRFSPMDEGQRRAVMSAFESGQTESRETRQMVTGNIPAGYAQFTAGQIVLYTDSEGALKQGVILPRDMNAGARLAQRPARFSTPAQITQFLAAEPGSRTVYSEDRTLMLTFEGGTYRLTIATRGANKYILNRAVRAITGDFSKRNGQKVYRKEIRGRSDFEQVLTIYADNLGTQFDTTTDKDAARAITGEEIPRIPGEDDDAPMFRIAGQAPASAGGQTFTGDLAKGRIRWSLSERASSGAAALGRRLEAEFAKSGLPGFAVAVSERLFGTLPSGTEFELDGAYYQGAVLVSMAGNRDPMATARHELVHALRDAKLWGRDYGLFRKAEWDALERAAKADPRLAEVAALYESDADAVEEVIADLYAEWVAGQEAKGFLRAAFARIKEAIAAVGRALRGEGFTGPDAVFRRVQSGEIGRRQASPRDAADGDGPRFAITPQGKRNASVSKVVGANVTSAVTPGMGTQPRQESFLRAAMTQPIDQAFRIPFAVIGGLDNMGRWKPGKWAEKKITAAITTAPMGFMTPLVERARAGLVDRHGLDPAYIERDRRRGVDEGSIAREGVEHLQALASANLSRGEYAVLQAVLTGDAVPDAEMAKLSEPVRQSIDALGAEAVQLGLISEESYERNRGAYLHRVYSKHEVDMGSGAKKANRLGGAIRRKIIGNQFKGRGIFEEVSGEKILRDNAEFLNAQRGKPQKGDKLRLLVLKAKAGTDPLTGLESPKGRTIRKVWVPANRPVPAALNNYEDRGTFEVRGTKGEKLVMWRDFTKAERLKMGEILDARYTVGKTYALMAHDLANGRFFKDIALNPAWSRKDPPPDGKGIDNDPQARAAMKRLWADPEIEWVRVPDSKIASSDTYTYGQLAGRYVKAEIWRDMEEVRLMHSRGFWSTLMREWKLNKTVRNPVVHMNNVMSNFILMDMADVRMPDLIAGIASMVTKDADYQQAALEGAFGGDMVSQELRDNVLKPMLEQLRREAQGGKGGIEGILGGRFAMAGWMADMAVKGVKWANKASMDAYQLEDQVFRMATYIRRKQQGASSAEAAIEARDQFLNYDIRAPWINAARRTVLPFLAYTYRAAPKVAQATLERPWKIAKYAVALQMANALAYAVAGSDDEEEDERRSMRKEEQGLTWLRIPFTDYGVERMVRMPWLAEDGRPVFLDIRRWIPVGDLFDLSHGDMPAWAQAGGPLMVGAELALNRSAFFDKEIWSEYDTFPQRMMSRADYLWKAFAPQPVFVPNSWYWTKIARANRDALDYNGEAYSVSEAWLGSFGIKVKPHSVSGGFEGWRYEFEAEEAAFGQVMNRAANHYSRGLISEEALNDVIEDYTRKMEGVAKRRAEIFQ